MPIVPQSEILVKFLEEILKETHEKRGEILAKFSVDFRSSISREIGHKKFHTNSSTHQDLKFHTAEPKFFHNDTLRVGGPNFFWKLESGHSCLLVPISRCLCPLGAAIPHQELLFFAINCYYPLLSAIKRH